MKFGRTAEEAAAEPVGTGGDFIRYLKEGDTTFRILQDPDDWVYYKEHYNPGGYPFPCTNEKDSCPGCTSDNEKMKIPSRKVVFNALQSYNGNEYVSAWKLTPTCADKLKNRFDRIGTLTDRDYRITKYKTTAGKTDYDVEGETPSKVSIDTSTFKDIESLLAAAYEEAWGSPEATSRTNAGVANADRVQTQVKHEAEQPADPPSKPEAKQSTQAEGDGEITVTEDELRKMTPKDLRMLCIQEFDELPPAGDSNQIVDWIMSKA